MLLFGYLEYVENGVTKRVVSPTGGYELYLRDAVANFGSTPPGSAPSDPTSDMLHGDHCSGIRYIKYPLYGDDDEGQLKRTMWKSDCRKSYMPLPNANSEAAM